MTFVRGGDYAYMQRILVCLILLLPELSEAQLTYSFDPVTQTQTWRFHNGNPAKIYQWRDTGRAQDRHVIDFAWPGIKTEEYSVRYGMYYDTLRMWDEEGHLSHIEIFSDSGYVSIDYMDNSQLIMQRGEYKLLGKIQNPLSLQDTAKGISYFSKSCEYACYAPTGKWNKFHPNGALESTGKYLPYCFEAHEVHRDTLDTDHLCYEAGTIVVGIVATSNVLLRDGTWYYFDQTGRIVREEFYSCGLLRNTKEFH